MTAKEIKKKDSEYIMHTYGRFDIVLDHGKGATLWDADGKEYVDLTSGIGVNSLGHGNEKIVGAITKQAEKLMHASNLYYTEPMVSAAEKLAIALKAKKLIMLTDVRGLLRDPSDESTLIKRLKVSEVPSLVREGIIKGGMIPKVNCCVECVRQGVERANIQDGRVPHSILIELLTNEGVGTMFS